MWTLGLHDVIKDERKLADEEKRFRCHKERENRWVRPCDRGLKGETEEMKKTRFVCV